MFCKWKQMIFCSQLIRSVPLLAASSPADLPLRYQALSLASSQWVDGTQFRKKRTFPLPSSVPGGRLRLSSGEEGVQWLALLHRFSIFFHILTIMIKNTLFFIKPNDPKSRPDRNECEEWNIDSCDQKCENTDGSYKVVDCDVDYQKARELWNGKLISYQQCTCVAGYELTGRTHCQVSFSSWVKLKVPLRSKVMGFSPPGEKVLEQNEVVLHPHQHDLLHGERRKG